MTVRHGPSFRGRFQGVTNTMRALSRLTDGTARDDYVET